VIEDAAQGVGGAVSGVPLGGTGDFGILSFGRGKGMTGGGGGALLIADAESRRRAEEDLVVADHGSRARFAMTLFAQWLLARPALYALPSALPFLGLGETVFRAPNPPRAMRADSARVLMQTISLSDREAERRRRNADTLRAMLGDDADRLVSVPSALQPGWLRFPVRGERHPSQVTRGASLGCVPGYPRSLDTLPEAQANLAHPPRVPGARELASRLWTVPVHGLLTNRDIRAVGAWIRRLPATASGGATPEN
jgi:dTDP-4-amino-4,6-dideoxygalactose transaminase